MEFVRRIPFFLEMNHLVTYLTLNSWKFTYFVIITNLTPVQYIHCWNHNSKIVKGFYIFANSIYLIQKPKRQTDCQMGPLNCRIALLLCPFFPILNWNLIKMGSICWRYWLGRCNRSCSKPMSTWQSCPGCSRPGQVQLCSVELVPLRLVVVWCRLTWTMIQNPFMCPGRNVFDWWLRESIKN